MKRLSLFISFMLLYFAINSFAHEVISGNVFTLPINFGEQGPMPTTVPDATVKYNEYYSTNSNQDGIFNFSNVNQKDIFILSAEKSGYLNSYTLPSPYVPEQAVMLFSSQMLSNLGITLQTGKGALFVMTYKEVEILKEGGEESILITGASALVRNLNGQNVGNIKYVAFAPGENYGIVLKNSPDSNPIDQGGTFGFFVYNIDPGIVMVSASKTGYQFIWRPAFIYESSITTGLPPYGGIIGKEVVQQPYTMDISGFLYNENEEPVGDATITVCGLNINATTDNDGSFTLENVPLGILILRARATSYIDTYIYGPVFEEEIDGNGEEAIELMIFSNEFLEKFGLILPSNKGFIVGMIQDENGNPVKYSKVYGWKEENNLLPVSYVDCMGENIIEGENVFTSDSGLFGLIKENQQSGIGTEKPVFLYFETFDKDGINYWASNFNLGIAFPNGITLLPLSPVPEVRGLLKLIQKSEVGNKVVEPEEETELFYGIFNLTNIDNGILENKKLLSFTITLTITGPNVERQGFEEWIKVQKKDPETSNWIDIEQFEFETNDNKWTFTFPGGLNFYSYHNNTGILELRVLVKLTESARGKTYKAEIEKNCEVEVIDVVIGGNDSVYISAEGAPIEGDLICVQKQGYSITVDRSSIDFGEVEINNEKTESITVINNGSSQVTVTPTIEGQDASQFTITPDTQFTLEVGQSTNITIKFKPTSSGVKNATLKLTYGEDSQQIEVTLTGEGITVPTEGKGGCFIATAAFGSPLNRYVKILREFRDRYLLTNKPGRIFVKWYYKYSPNIAEIISKNILLKKITQILLIPFIIFAYLALYEILPYITFFGVLILFLKKR